MKRHTLRLLLLDVTFISIVSYLLLFAIRNTIHSNLYAIPGVLLLFYLPGRALIDLYRPLQSPWGTVGKAGLAVFLSTAMTLTLQLFLMSHHLSVNTTIAPILILNGVLYFSGLIKALRYPDSKVESNSTKTSLKDMWPILLVLLVLTITIILSPYPADADGFLTAFQTTIECNCYNLAFRPLFVSYLALSHMVLGIPILILFRALFPLLFFISTWFLFDYAKRHIKLTHNANIAYLLLLAAPSILSEINIIRPQVAMISLTLPILVLVIESWRLRNLMYTGLAFWLAILALGFHELSVFLVLAAAMPLLVRVFSMIFIQKRFTIKQILFAAIVIYPYYFLLPFESYFIRVSSILLLIKSLLPPLQWRWWFINNYTTIDGYNIGWPGAQAVYYYAYNGFLLLLFALLLALWVKFKRLRVEKAAVIPFIYALIFLCFAEIMPRFGFFFLPNRAWVHLMLGLVVLVVLLYQSLGGMRVSKWLSVILPSALIVVGIAGTLYVARNNVSEVFREEIPAVRFMKGTAPDSLFISSQNNHTLVRFYGKRAFIDMRMNQKIDHKLLEQLFNKKIDELSTRHIQTTSEIREEIKRYENNEFISERVMVIRPQQVSIIEPTYKSGAPIYFIYSYRKASGVNGSRSYQRSAIDLINKDSYKGTNYKTVFDDGSVLILQIR